MLILGIDPGKKGALAILDTEEDRIDVHDMPQTTTELHDLIAGLPKVRKCILEKIYSGRVMGRATIATAFESYGILKGALAWKCIPVREVRPNEWKPALNLSGDKSASRNLAMQMWPDQADLFKRVKDDGRAEAALLAHYGRKAND